MTSVIVVGAGVGGLTAGALLARQGVQVLVLERDRHLGGKLRVENVGGHRIDAGPTVLTMRHVFDRLFTDVGARLSDYVTLTRLSTLARHVWPDGSTLDLFDDTDRSAEAVAAFAGASEAAAYRRFVRYTERLHEIVEGPFMSAERPTMASMLAKAGRLGVKALYQIDAHRTMHEAVAGFFHDRRLLQLFDRYATYCGSNPFTAPATLNVIAHVEKAGVHAVDGGMGALADALVRLAQSLGVLFRTDAHVAEVVAEGEVARGVRLASGEVLRADAVLFNGDVNALRCGLLGPSVMRAAPETKHASLSATTIAAMATARGVDLARHNVFFSDDYEEEFAAIERGEAPSDPTLYVCAQDRGEVEGERGAPERVFVIANRRARAADAQPGVTEDDRARRMEARWTAEITAKLARYGLTLDGETQVVTTPEGFAARFPGTGGAIYGPSSIGMWSSFSRAGSRTALKRLYLCGGSVHPGAGVPMAATSGRLSAEALLSDLPSTARSLRTGTLGGIWMR